MMGNDVSTKYAVDNYWNQQNKTKVSTRKTINVGDNHSHRVHTWDEDDGEDDDDDDVNSMPYELVTMPGDDRLITLTQNTKNEHKKPHKLHTY